MADGEQPATRGRFCCDEFTILLRQFATLTLGAEASALWRACLQSTAMEQSRDFADVEALLVFLATKLAPERIGQPYETSALTRPAWTGEHEK